MTRRTQTSQRSGSVEIPTITRKYGLEFNPPALDFQVELAAFREGLTVAQGGLGKYQHLKRASRILFPGIDWHDWAEEQLKSLCRSDYAWKSGGTIHRFVTWTGCAAAGKTFQSAHYALLWWLADPENSKVILTSTTKIALRQRVWPVIQQLYNMARESISERYGVDISKVNCGHMMDSRTMLQAVKGDDKHSIFAQSVEDGTAKAVANIQGQHAKRILLNIDEATDTPEAIFRAIPNLKKSCPDLTVLVIGNAVSRLDPHGRISEPLEGWSSVTHDATEWLTGEVRDFGVSPGICLHFAGGKSPNVKAGRTLHPHVYTWEDHQMAQKSGTDTVHYWKWDEGFWAPEGVCNTVMSEVMVLKYDGKGKLLFGQWSKPIAGLDPAFGGDKCVLKFGIMGDLGGDKIGVQLTETVEINTKAESKDEIDYQIARKVIEECKARGVDPWHYGGDATGIGRGVHAIIAAEWSAKVQRVEFGGAASDLPASESDPRPCSEVYDRKVTELWYSCKEFLMAGQLKGLSNEEIIQFSHREYELKNRKIRLHDKAECKKRIGRSPDEADSVSVLVAVAKENGAMPGGKLAADATDDWDKEVSANQAMYANAEYQDDFVAEEVEAE